MRRWQCHGLCLLHVASRCWNTTDQISRYHRLSAVFVVGAGSQSCGDFVIAFQGWRRARHVTEWQECPLQIPAAGACCRPPHCSFLALRRSAGWRRRCAIFLSSSMSLRFWPGPLARGSGRGRAGWARSWFGFDPACCMWLRREPRCCSLPISLVDSRDVTIRDLFKSSPANWRCQESHKASRVFYSSIFAAV